MLNTNSVSSIGILATGSAFPGEEYAPVTNETIHSLRFGPDWESHFRATGMDPEYPRKKYGFQKRYHAHTPGTSQRNLELTSADLMERAVKRALRDFESGMDEIDLFIAFTTTSPRYTSSIATLVAGRLGLSCAAFEMKSGCSSAIYALSLAYRMIASGGIRNVLVAGADTLSKVTGLHSPHLYAAGDGAGALILGPVRETDRGLYSTYLDSNGAFADAMGVPGRLPPTEEDFRNEKYMMELKPGVEEIIFETWKKIPDVLYKTGIVSPDDLRFFLPHPVNQIVTGVAREAAQLPEERVISYLGDYGNVGPSGILIALDRSLRDGTLQPGDRGMLAAVGGGLAWGGMVLEI